MSLEHWFVRFSRFGTTHLVRAQEGPTACGAAVAMMAACRMNKWGTIKEAMYSETEVYRKVNAGTSYPAATGQHFTGSNAGIAATEVAELMNSLHMGQWHGSNVGENAVAGTIYGDANVFQLCTIPVIAAVQWVGSPTQHWVLIDQVFNVLGNKYAIVNDPGDANIHVMELKFNQRMTYNAKRPTFSFELWGDNIGGTKLKDAYGTGASGYFYGDVVRCTSMNVLERVQHALLA